MAPRRGARRPKTYDELCEGLPNHSLFVLGKGNPMRKAMIKVVKSQTFDQFILLLILANCVFLAMDTKEVLFEESAWGKATAMSEHIFTGIYVVEMCMKMEDGKYLLVKDANKPILRTYIVGDGEFNNDYASEPINGH